VGFRHCGGQVGEAEQPGFEDFPWVEGEAVQAADEGFRMPCPRALAALSCTASGMPCGSFGDVMVPVPAAQDAEALNSPAVAPRAAGARWEGFHARARGRGPRRVLLAACDLFGSGEGRTAIDLGCGAGVDALALLARGWSVTAIDGDPAALDLLRARVPAGSARRARIVCAAYTEAVLSRADLIHAGYSLPFCAPAEFPVVWAGIRGALLPGGVFAGQLLGVGDSWAGSAGMSFQDLEQVRELLDGLEVLQLRETERDGEAVSGPKRWHVYDILARRPV
jgi:SAM-dependent methyltransferase